MTPYEKAKEAAETAILNTARLSDDFSSVEGCLQAALSAFRAHGYVLVPETLSDAMAGSFDSSCAYYLNYEGGHGDDGPAAQAAWDRMLSAAQQETSDPQQAQDGSV